MTPASPFDVPEFLRQLRAVGCSLGEPMHYFATTTSTNDEAKAAATLGAPNGATFLADHQSAGRGRRGRQWHAPPNCQILMSIIWRPRTANANTALTLAVGSALHRTLSTEVRSPGELRIKWPNDVEHAGKKLAGILVEGASTPEHGLYTIIGIGLNVRPVPAESCLPVTPTSLQELGSHTPRETLLVRLLRALDTELGHFERDGSAAPVAYVNQHHALTGETIVADGLEGVVVEVASDGALVLQTAAGRRQVTSGTVERIARQGR